MNLFNQMQMTLLKVKKYLKDKTRKRYDNRISLTRYLLKMCRRSY